MANNGIKMWVFRIIHRVFHSFTHQREVVVENFFRLSHTLNPRFDKRRHLWYNNKKQPKVVREKKVQNAECGVIRDL